MARFSWVLLCAVGCVPAADRTVVVAETLPSAALGPSAAPANPSPPRVLGREAPLAEGRVVWEGMVRPTKGGYDVRGVTLDDDVLPRLLRASAVDGFPADPEWFLGAIVRVTAVLRRDGAVDDRFDGGLAVQTRTGAWFTASRVEGAELVVRAESVEGVLGRSKGLYRLGKYLVDDSDLAWAVRGAGVGTHVRCWGQPRTVVCRPNEQCLLGGTLPIFDVGRAERLP